MLWYVQWQLCPRFRRVLGSIYSFLDLCRSSQLTCACTRALLNRLRTLHGLLNSKPGGAFTLSDCPRRKPVSLRSRSITANFQLGQSLHFLSPHDCARMYVVDLTLPIPLVYRVPCPFAAILHVSDFTERGAREAEHLSLPSVLTPSRLVSRGCERDDRTPSCELVSMSVRKERGQVHFTMIP